MGALGFGMAGTVGGLCIRSSRSLVLRSTAGFTLGGALGGVLLVSPFLIPCPDSILVEHLLTMTLTLGGLPEPSPSRRSRGGLRIGVRAPDNHKTELRPPRWIPDP